MKMREKKERANERKESVCVLARERKREERQEKVAEREKKRCGLCMQEHTAGQTHRLTERETDTRDRHNARDKSENYKT